MLVIAACALSGWWLAVRPNASYRGVSSSVSFLIICMAVLLCILALSGQQARAQSTLKLPDPALAATDAAAAIEQRAH